MPTWVVEDYQDQDKVVAVAGQGQRTLGLEKTAASRRDKGSQRYHNRCSASCHPSLKLLSLVALLVLRRQTRRQ